VLDSDDEAPRRRPGLKTKRPGLAGGLAGRVLGGLRQEGRAVLTPATAPPVERPPPRPVERSTLLGSQAPGLRASKLLVSAVTKRAYGVRASALKEKVHKPQLVPAGDVRPRPASGSTAKAPFRSAAESDLRKRLWASLRGGDPAPGGIAGRRTKAGSVLASNARALKQALAPQDPPSRVPAARKRRPSPPSHRSSASAASEAAPSQKRRRATPAAVAVDPTAPGGKGPQIADDPAFQAVIHARLKELCGEFHDDAEVLAEYIFIMIKGNKGSADMVEELMPFLEDQEAAENFVSWVEETKSQMQSEHNGASPATGSGKVGAARAASRRTAARSAASVAASGPKRQKAAVAARQAAPPSSSSESSTGGESAAIAAAAGRTRPRPLTAVTAKCVLRPHPDLGKQAVDSVSSSSASSPPPAVSSGGPPRRTPSAAAAQFQKSVAAPNISKAAVKRDKKELLANMTKQLQVILAKLQDKGLNDETRDKYQALAQTIQLQMFNLSNPAANPAIVKGHSGRSGR